MDLSEFGEPFNRRELDDWRIVADRLGLRYLDIKFCKGSGYTMSQTLLLLHKDRDLIQFACGLTTEKLVFDLREVIRRQEEALDGASCDAYYLSETVNLLCGASVAAKKLLLRLKAPIEIEIDNFKRETPEVQGRRNGSDSLVKSIQRGGGPSSGRRVFESPRFLGRSSDPDPAFQDLDVSNGL